ncbi:hypothetical protein [Aeromonas veronii]|uniref:hypothetical protein n=2 Tax=Aeromonadaceae TaxID=84642 RepID=UPI0011C86754|nr:hypothetical protein [Aeromonas veronii]
MQREIVKADDLNLPNGEYGSHFATTVGHEYFKMQGSVTVSCSNGTIIMAQPLVVNSTSHAGAFGAA